MININISKCRIIISFSLKGCLYANDDLIKFDLTQMAFLHQRGNAVIKHILDGLELEPQALQL